MPPARARLVRRAPLSERLQAYLSPGDWLLWLSEELNSNDWEDFSKQWSAAIGILLNISFMIARSNSSTDPSASDDVFGDTYGRRGSGWLSWLMAFVSHSLTILSVLNACYTFLRKRHYRLFEHSVDITPSTPSARRVRVDSSPMSLSSSPLRQITHIITSSLSSDSSASSRAHPDPTRDVWEVAVWDPSPLCLALFTFFSPGHVLIYSLFLPLKSLDPRPSVTVFTTVVLAALLTVQLVFMSSSFQAQIRDNDLISRQVHAEYDAKFVKPNLNRPVRDVGTQLSFTSTGTPVSGDRHRGTPEVQTYTPTTYVNRGFQVHPNTNYEGLYSPDGVSSSSNGDGGNRLGRSVTESVLYTPIAAAAAARAHRPVPRVSSDFSSPLKAPPVFAGRGTTPLANSGTPGRSQAYQQTGGDGGHFGIYKHAQSPLKRAAAANVYASATSPDKQGHSGVRRSLAPSASSTTLGERSRQPRGTADDYDRHRKTSGRY